MGRYPALRFIRIALRTSGWIVFAVGGMLLALSISALASGGATGPAQMGGALGIAASGILVVSGLITAALGELIGVFVDIEANTRQRAPVVSGPDSGYADTVETEQESFGPNAFAEDDVEAEMVRRELERRGIR